MNDDREFIDLDSTQNWSQLDVKRELDNREVDAETGKQYDFARGFSDDKKAEEDKILLDGLTSGLNYIPEEFLMAADEKHQTDIENKPEEERPDVSWAYRKESDESVDDEPFIPIADIKKAEEEAAKLRAAEVTAAKAKEAEIEAIREKNLEEQAKRLAEANASDALVRANILARKQAREAIAAQNEARIREEAEARKAAQKQAEIDMYKDQMFDLDDLDIPVMTKEERIAAANKNRKDAMVEYDAIVTTSSKKKVEESVEVAEEIKQAVAEKAEKNEKADKTEVVAEGETDKNEATSGNEVKTEAANSSEIKTEATNSSDEAKAKAAKAEEAVDLDDAPVNATDVNIEEVVYELDEVEQEQVKKDFEQEKVLSTGDTGVIYLDDDGEEIKPVEKADTKKAKATSATEEYLAWADSEEEQYEKPKKKKKKKKRPVPVYNEDSSEEGIEDMEYADEEDGDDIYYIGFWDKVVKFFKGMSGLDYLVAGTGILVVVVALITLTVYSSSKATQAKINEFISLGEKMQTIGTTGNEKLVAVLDAKRAVAEVIEEEIIEEEQGPVEYEEKEEENSVISVKMTLTSVKKDLKIKFVNDKNKKLVGNHEFKVAIEDSKGKKYNAADDDKDGIIYIASVEPGKAKVTMVEIEDKDVTFSKEAQTVDIKENIDYKKIDVADEVKKESEINAKVEDTAQKDKVEGALKDTVEWVESTKTASEGGYTSVDKKNIIDPAKAVATVTPAKTASANNVNVISNRIASSKHIIPAPYMLLAPVDPPEGGDPAGGPTEEEVAATNAAATAQAESDANATASAAASDNDAAATNAAATNAAVTNAAASAAAGDATATNAAATNAAATNAVATNAAATNAVATNAAATNAAATAVPTLTASAKNAAATASAAAKASNPAEAVKSDTVTPLKDKNGNQLYIKDANGNYKEAAYADYYTAKEFYRKGGEYIYTGWQEIDGETYFFDKNGNKVTGEQVIQGAKYNFDSTGALVKGSGTMGIDVSKWNADINWTAVKNSGVSFVIIRCGYRGSSSGALVEDPKFRANIKGATDAGLKVGVYFFSQATTDVEAVEEASMAISLMKGYKISYPVFLDVEDSGGRGDRIDSNTRTAVIKAFCETVKNSGYTPGVYANKSWLTSKMNVSALNSYKIWLAQYNAQPTYTGKYDLWQYSSKGTVNGIKGSTDMNLSYLGY